MRMTTSMLMELHTKLFLEFGDPQWWPGDTPFEVCIGAILTQNTSWSNVERAISNLKERSLLSPSAMTSVQANVLSEAIRPSGYYNRKAARLRAFCAYLLERYEGDLEMTRDVPVLDLRNELLAIGGIGNETADSILCYALDRPVLVIDAYTFRALSRIFGSCPELPERGSRGSYGTMQGLLMGLLKGDACLYNRFHALLVLLGKERCRTAPCCIGCPVGPMCWYASSGTEGRA